GGHESGRALSPAALARHGARQCLAARRFARGQGLLASAANRAQVDQAKPPVPARRYRAAAGSHGAAAVLERAQLRV
nr:hypothetical protein [Tanacetum cinerariifolium]